MADQYSHMKNGKHLRYVELVKRVGDTMTVRILAGRNAGKVYDVSVSDLRPHLPKKPKATARVVAKSSEFKALRNHLKF